MSRCWIAWSIRVWFPVEIRSAGLWMSACFCLSIRSLDLWGIHRVRETGRDGKISPRLLTQQTSTLSSPSSNNGVLAMSRTGPISSWCQSLVLVWSG